MAFDQRSLDALKALGRTLPVPLPVPEPKPQPSAGGNPHPLETETDPQRLFEQLMQASPDGTVPPHLLERLRQLETQQGQSSGSSTAAKAPRKQASRAPSADPLYVAFAQMLLEDSDDS